MGRHSGGGLSEHSEALRGGKCIYRDVCGVRCWSVPQISRSRHRVEMDWWTRAAMPVLRAPMAFCPGFVPVVSCVKWFPQTLWLPGLFSWALCCVKRACFTAVDTGNAWCFLEEEKGFDQVFPLMWNVNWQSMPASFLLLLSSILFFCCSNIVFSFFCLTYPLSFTPFFFLTWKIRHSFLFKILFQSSFMFLYFSSVYNQSKLIHSKARADRVPPISLFLFQGPSVHAVLPLADSRMAMGYAVRGWRQTWRSTGDSCVFDSNARGRNGWIACFQHTILYLFLGLEEENWATYKRSSKLPWCSSGFSALHATDKLSGTASRGRCCVIASKK